MANIKNLQMWNDICADNRISISKSLFGLKTIVTYNKTQSKVSARTIQLSPSDGEHLKRFLERTKNDIENVIGNFHPKEVANGNYMLELALSEDGNYLALLLHQFTQLSYEPVTKMLTFEGNEAQTISKLF